MYKPTKDLISNCLNCKIGISIMSKYVEIIDEINPYMKDIKDMEDKEMIKFCELSEQSKSTVNEIFKLLNIQTDDNSKLPILIRLTSNNTFDDDTDTPCLVQLQFLMYLLRYFFQASVQRYNTEVDATKISPKDKININSHDIQQILKLMHKLNIEGQEYRKIFYNEKELSKGFLKSQKKSNDESNEIDADTLLDVFEHFIDRPQKREDKAFKILTQADCSIETLKLFMKYFAPLQKIVKTHNNTLLYFKRVQKLPKKMQYIILNYIHNAPKNFGFILEALMKEQALSEQDVAKLMYDNTHPSFIQSLKKSTVPKLDPKLNKEKISEIRKRLSRIFLVSEDVFSKGYGQIYGNWNELIKSEKELEATQKYIIKYCSTSKDLIKHKTNKITYKDIENAFEHCKEFSDETTTEQVIIPKEFTPKKASHIIVMMIKSVLECSDEEFEEIVAKTFYDGTFSAFQNDYECFENLLNPREAFTLLEVLEKMNKEI